jgi:1-aminocyclopropane-1-carboxylate deaminase
MAAVAHAALDLHTPTRVERLDEPVFDALGLELFVKRDDEIHPGVPGNKARKLRYNLETASADGHDTLLSFGGAFSNHIFALANAGAICGFSTIGVIRGERREPLNPVLAHAERCGMTLEFMDRTTYRQRDDPALAEELARRHGRFFLVPEGGSNADGVRGCAEVIDELDAPFDVVACACGTGGTLAGLIAGLQGRGEGLGVPVLKGGSFLVTDIRALLAEAGHFEHPNWSLACDYHFGGYARTTPELISFVRDFETRHGVPLDPIYTGKLFFGLLAEAEAGRFERGTRVLAIHTGGAPSAHTETLMH